ncbi:hypothetical protein DUNSADRAFT_8386 [Dunaliella salina]|uniref:Uncharacterized protein n=1 Tax=Dunaliella salina TaxID=3046 RepID=A0ABQ7GJL1_DUNSA|nr:hypothetical protein DUNSADRAFT_8386 [Dunaliella salina]|eukprot:KAF5834802.1 hypothetical protein DUNSADRAFT_8386 [Dunaliella salina]
MPRAKKRGTWSSYEDESLKRLVSIHGEGHWSKIAQHLNEECGVGEGSCGRIGKQCRERWLHHLQPGICHTPWSEAEAVQLVSLHEQLGNHFSAIAKYLPGRTENSCKNFWNATRRCKAPDTRARAIVKAYVDALEQQQQQQLPPQQQQQQQQQQQRQRRQKQQQQEQQQLHTSQLQPLKSQQQNNLTMRQFRKQQQQQQQQQQLPLPNLDPCTRINSNSSSSSSCSSSGGHSFGNKASQAQQEGRNSADAASTPSHSSDSSSILHDFCPPPCSPAAALRPSAHAQPSQPRQQHPQSRFLQSLQQQLMQLQQQRQREVWQQQQQQRQQQQQFQVPIAAPCDHPDPAPRQQDQEQQHMGIFPCAPSATEAQELPNRIQHAAQPRQLCSQDAVQLHLPHSQGAAQLRLLHSQDLNGQSTQPVGQEDLQAAAHLLALRALS